MLTIKTYISKSSIDGIGLFANEFIPKGTVIWELAPQFDRIYSQQELDKLSPAAKEHIRHYAYFNAAEGGYVLCVDNAKFMNHLKEPNCIAVGLTTIATQNINIGDEITEDYYNFDELAEQKFE